ncbi:hypothetical protein L2750_13945 [Shewanella submarina]|uniref:Uncharacterized protein n=1 Tax=Shewanella submarina TaxID=2016376 RepID=A0ABV7GEB4_9GAMM|nr:hypothetical protein [Shewanella submarina]MCL1038246.1 hypothetical protein [Shewanella submarina]
MRKLSAALFLIHWPLSIFLMGYFNLYSAWYFSDYALEAELITGLCHLLLTLYGFSVFFPKGKLYVSLFAALVFTFYQTFAFGLGINRYTAKLDLNSDAFIILEKFDSGALSGRNFAQLSLLETRYGLFLSKTVIESYNDVLSGTLTSKNGAIVLTVEHFDKQVTRDYLSKS